MSLTTEAQFNADLDHLVWASPDLSSGVEQIAELFAVEPIPGGSHPGLGTRNALLGLEGRQYFEILAPDPEQSQFRSFGRWIEGLSSPGLLTWAGRTSDLEALSRAARTSGLQPGPIESMSRRRPDGSSLSWKLMMIAGHDFGPLVPFFIEWDGFHPSQALEPVARLQHLRLATPSSQALKAILTTLGVESAPIQVVEAEGQDLSAELSVDGRLLRLGGSL